MNEVRAHLDCPGPRPCILRTAVVFLLSLFVAVGGGAAAGPLGEAGGGAGWSIRPDGLPDQRVLAKFGLPQMPGRVVHEEREGSGGEGGRGRGQRPVAWGGLDGWARLCVPLLPGVIGEGVLPEPGVRLARQLGARGPPEVMRD